MAKKAPGRSERKGMSLVQAVDMFSDEAQAEAWFVNQRWPKGVRCPDCDSDDVSARPTRKPQPFRCNACRSDFSVKTGSIMHGSKLSLKTWGVAMYLLTTNLKGVSSMKLHRDLGITQKAAWHLAHRIRKAWETESAPFFGPVEADETYIGGKEGNKHPYKKQIGARGSVDKTAVVGIRDRNTGRVSTAVVPDTTRETLHGFVHQRTQPYTTVFTDDARAYIGMHRTHESVNHSIGEYVRGMASTNGVESHWAMLKRGYQGVYHHMSEKHLGRYVSEFAGRHNDRPRDTIAQMGRMVRGAEGKRLRYEDLTA